MPRKLLLADDSITIQRVIELTFADEDITVSAVGDGDQAVERIEADPPDIVLADVGMPKRDGYEVAAYVKSRPELAHIPVVLLTGAFEPIDQARAAEVGCDGVLAKPFEPQMVINRVKQLLGGGRFSAPKRPTTVEPEPRSAGLASRGVDTQVVPAARPLARERDDVELPPHPRKTADPGVSLEDYFDQLDAAFAALDKPTGKADRAAPVPPQAPPPTDRPFTMRERQPAGPAAGPADDLLRSPSTPLPAESSALDAWLDGVQPVPGTAAGSLDFSDVSGLEESPRARLMPAGSGSGASGAAAAGRPAPFAAPAPAPRAPAVQESYEPPAIADAFAALLDAEVDAVQAVVFEPPPAGGTSTGPVGPSASSAIAAVPPGPAVAVVSDEIVEAVVRRVIARMSDEVVRDVAATLVPEIAERLVREELMKIKGKGQKGA